MKKTYKEEIILFLRNLYQKYNDDKSVLYLSLILDFIQENYPTEQISIDVLELPTRISNALKRFGILYINQLLAFNVDGFSKISNISCLSAYLIDEKLKNYLSGDKK